MNAQRVLILLALLLTQGCEKFYLGHTVYEVKLSRCPSQEAAFPEEVNWRGARLTRIGVKPDYCSMMVYRLEKGWIKPKQALYAKLSKSQDRCHLQVAAVHYAGPCFKQHYDKEDCISARAEGREEAINLLDGLTSKLDPGQIKSKPTLKGYIETKKEYQTWCGDVPMILPRDADETL